MRKNQYIRFYTIRGRRIKKIRGYVRLKDKSETKALNECCDNDNLIFESAYDNGPYSITYSNIIKLISLHLDSLRVNYSLTYDAVGKVLNINLGSNAIIINLDDLITTVLNLKSERKSLTDYVRRTIWIGK